MNTIPWPVALLGFLAFVALFGFFVFYLKRQPEEEQLEEKEVSVDESDDEETKPK